jgi:hypothetical protein
VLLLFDNSAFEIAMYDGTTYVYPGGAIAIGWGLAFSSVLFIPIMGIRDGIHQYFYNFSIFFLSFF